MGSVRTRGEAVRRFIIENVARHPSDIVKLTATQFGNSRQAVHKHIRRLLDEHALTKEGSTRARTYHLAALFDWHQVFKITPKLQEDAVWRSEISPRLERLPSNVIDIWHYGFTEMFNNAIEHSGGGTVTVSMLKTAATTKVSLHDDGIGIFRKIQAALELVDERHSVLELAKGKFTSDPANHTGEGIFFSSRMFDRFMILSGGVYFQHEYGTEEDWIVEPQQPAEGTTVTMELDNHTARSSKKIFDDFTDDDDYGFTKTVVPVKLTRYGDDNLISRSQAKRLLVRIDRFKHVVFDFSEVTSIGQAFADEVFRVFANKHPEIVLTVVNAGPDVAKMISRARLHV